MQNENTPDLPVEMTIRTKNTLPAQSMLKLADWCRANRSACETETYTRLASIAGPTLGFTVTAANMSSIIEACEIERKKPEAPPTLEEQLTALRDRLNQTETDSKALRGTLAEILAAMQALTGRVNRLELHEEGRNTDVPAVHPELGLPTPQFGETGGSTLPFDTDVGDLADTSVVVFGE